MHLANGVIPWCVHRRRRSGLLELFAANPTQVVDLATLWATSVRAGLDPILAHGLSDGLYRKWAAAIDRDGRDRVPPVEAQ